MTIILFKIVLIIWTVTLWWLVGSIVLYLNHRLPKWGEHRQQAVIFWPVVLFTQARQPPNRLSNKN